MWGCLEGRERRTYGKGGGVQQAALGSGNTNEQGGHELGYGRNGRAQDGRVNETL